MIGGINQLGHLRRSFSIGSFQAKLASIRDRHLTAIQSEKINLRSWILPKSVKDGEERKVPRFRCTHSPPFLLTFADVLLLLPIQKPAMSPAEVTEKLGLHRMRDRSWFVHPSCATSGEVSFSFHLDEISLSLGLS